MRRSINGFVMILLVPTALLGWSFDTKPKTLEDCILEKMKGQQKAMYHYAEKVCRKMFPYEPEDFLDHMHLDSFMADGQWPKIGKQKQRAVLDVWFKDKIVGGEMWENTTPKTKEEVRFLFFKKAQKRHKELWPTARQIDGP